MKYVSGPYTQGQLMKDIHEVEISLTRRFDRQGVITDATEQRSWKERLEDNSFGRNTVVYDDQGNPSVMVVIPAFTELDVLAGGRNIVHPAFIVNGVTKPYMYISKYQNYTTGAGATLRAIGLKHKDPGAYINFDNSLLACKQKGTGWHLMTNAEWAAIALWCKSQGFYPRGNNSYGKDYAVTTERGVATLVDATNICRVATGSGPVGWSHDGSPFGIYDLNGNVWEWVSGMRTNGGEIQVLQDNNAADNTQDQTSASVLWKAMLQDGSLVAPGTALTLKYDFVATPANGGALQINTTTQANAGDLYGYKAFETLPAAGGVTVPNQLKLLALAPIDSNHGSDAFYCNTNAERVAVRGGGWYDSSSAGVFSLNLINPRTSAHNSLGFRSAFVPS